MCLIYKGWHILQNLRCRRTRESHNVQDLRCQWGEILGKENILEWAVFKNEAHYPLWHIVDTTNMANLANIYSELQSVPKKVYSQEWSAGELVTVKD